MIPYSYGNIYSSISIYIPVLIALIIMLGTIIIFFKFKDKLINASQVNRIAIVIGTFILLCTICTCIVTIPYKKMAPSNENAKYEVVGITDIISCDTENQTVTVIKDGKEVTEPTLISITYDEPHLEVRRYSWLGMYRDYNVTLIASPDAVKVDE